MNRIDEFKLKRNGSLLVVSTLGLAAIFSKSVRPAWTQNIFAGTSLNNGSGFWLKCLSIFLLTCLTATIFFIIHLIKLIVCQLQTCFLPQEQYLSRRGLQGSHKSNSDVNRVNDNHRQNDRTNHQREIHSYFLRNGHTIYGPYSLSELNTLGYNHNIPITVDNPNNWHAAAELFG